MNGVNRDLHKYDLPDWTYRVASYCAVIFMTGVSVLLSIAVINAVINAVPFHVTILALSITSVSILLMVAIALFGQRKQRLFHLRQKEIRRSLSK